MIKNSLKICALLAMAGAFMGCETMTSTGGGTAAKTGVAEKAAPAAAEAKATKGYWEHAHDGRIYVLGNPETHEKFAANPHLPYTKTMIAAGPKGETVIVEVDKDDPSMQETLWEKFRLRNLYYAEEEHDGRVYLLGSATSQLKFRETPHLSYTRTLIGRGEGGKTVVIEIDKENPALVQRLQNEYAHRHSIAF